MNEPSWIVRIVEVYDKHSQELVTARELKPIAAGCLQALWGFAPQNPMIDSLNIPPRLAVELNRYTDLEFDFEKYDYQLATYTMDLEAARASGGYLGSIPAPLELPAFPGLRSVKAKNPVDS